MVCFVFRFFPCLLLLDSEGTVVAAVASAVAPVASAVAAVEVLMIPLSLLLLLPRRMSSIMSSSNPSRIPVISIVAAVGYDSLLYVLV